MVIRQDAVNPPKGHEATGATAAAIAAANLDNGRGTLARFRGADAVLAPHRLPYRLRSFARSPRGLVACLYRASVVRTTLFLVTVGPGDLVSRSWSVLRPCTRLPGTQAPSDKRVLFK